MKTSRLYLELFICSFACLIGLLVLTAFCKSMNLSERSVGVEAKISTTHGDFLRSQPEDMIRYFVAEEPSSAYDIGPEIFVVLLKAQQGTNIVGKSVSLTRIKGLHVGDEVNTRLSSGRYIVGVMKKKN